MTPNNPGRILALDLGARRIGLALSDELGVTAQGLPTLQRSTRQQDIDKLHRLAAQHKVTGALVLADLLWAQHGLRHRSGA